MTQSKRPIGSDLAKVDATTDEDIARQIAEDPDTAPELTDEEWNSQPYWLRRFVDGYPAVIHKDPGSDFGVSFPDFPGCISAGRTIEEAMDMAEEALSLCIEEMRRAGEAIPERKEVKKHDR